jgi:hypothetical protein
MNSLRCSNCSFLNFATASVCKRCGLPFDSANGPDMDFHPNAPADMHSQPPPNGSYFWDQPNYRPNYPPPPVQYASGGGGIVKGVIILAVLALVAFVAIPKLLKAGKTNFANVTWQEYRSPDHKFSISLPVTPKETVVHQQTPLGSIPVTVLEAQVSKDGGCMLMHADYPLGERRISEDMIYESAINKQGLASKDVEMGARKYITHDGHRGVEIELKSSANSNLETAGTARLFWVSPRIYVLMSVGPDTADFRAFQPKCLESFKLY